MARRTRTGRGPDYRWRGTQVEETAITTAAIAAVILTATEACTLRRIRGNLQVFLGSATDGDLKRVAVGLCIRPEGFTGTPSALSDLEVSWLWHHDFILGYDAASPSTDAVWHADMEIDSKAQRKLKENDELVLVISPANITGTGTAAAIGVIRTLTSD